MRMPYGNKSNILNECALLNIIFTLSDFKNYIYNDLEYLYDNKISGRYGREVWSLSSLTMGAPLPAGVFAPSIVHFYTVDISSPN